MTKNPFSNLFKTLPLLLAAGALQAAEPGINVPFDAVYQVFVDGKPRMETRISLARNDGQWLMSSDGKGTKGLPRMLKFRNHERSEGDFIDGFFQPDSYSHETRVAGKDDVWSAAFSLADNSITTQHEEGSSSLEPASGTADPLSLTLAMRYHLGLGETGFQIKLVDETEIDLHDYQTDAPEQLDTSLGCFEVVPVKRIRENSTRYSQGWYASALAHFPVKLQHGKEGGREFEMKIISLQIDGKPITVPADCPS